MGRRKSLPLLLRLTYDNEGAIAPSLSCVSFYLLVLRFLL